MAHEPIPDSELLVQFDDVTIWVASPKAPTDIWSLREAILWALSQPHADKISLFRPPDAEYRAVWLNAERIARLGAAAPHIETPSQQAKASA